MSYSLLFCIDGTCFFSVTVELLELLKKSFLCATSPFAQRRLLILALQKSHRFTLVAALSKQWCYLYFACHFWVSPDGFESIGSERQRKRECKIYKKKRSKRSGKIAVYAFFLLWLDLLLICLGAITVLPRACQLHPNPVPLTGWGAVPKSLWWAVAEDAVSAKRVARAPSRLWWA